VGYFKFQSCRSLMKEELSSIRERMRSFFVVGIVACYSFMSSCAQVSLCRNVFTYVFMRAHFSYAGASGPPRGSGIRRRRRRAATRAECSCGGVVRHHYASPHRSALE
jgi:hypothetical protein